LAATSASKGKLNLLAHWASGFQFVFPALFLLTATLYGQRQETDKN